MSSLKRKFYILFLFVALVFKNGVCDNPFVYTDPEKESVYLGKFIHVLRDPGGYLGIRDVVTSKGFIRSFADIPNLGFTNSTIWLQFQIKNSSPENHLLLKLDAPLIDEVELYSFDAEAIASGAIGQNKNFDKRKYKHTSYLFDLYIGKEEVKTYFLKVKSYDQLELPLKIITPEIAFESATRHNYFFGIYCGIMLIMIFYNLFIYISVRDKSYLYYVNYIIAIMLTQATFQGYTFRYFWPDSPLFEIQSIHIMSILVGFASVQFLRIFLQTKSYVPKLDKVFLFAYALYAIALVMVISGFYQVSWILILCIVSPLSLFMLFVAIKIARIGFRPAKIFSVAWSIFLIGVFIYAMKDFGILPYNNFTVYTMPAGSAIETVLLSFALADRINVLKKEKEESQSKALELLNENDRIITQQNVILEARVKERTAELEASNMHLNDTKEQLINIEKMASLGQLTAGISHEINNPINFVISNVKPLKRDVDQVLRLIEKYKEIREGEDVAIKLKEIEELKKHVDLDYTVEEINLLLKGIDEGAKRTAEIVKGLKNFARTDEATLTKTDISECIDTTLSLLSGKIMPDKIKVVKNYGNLTPIDCFPGKLNQVFMNILDNAIQAIAAKNYNGNEGAIIIGTQDLQNNIEIRIKDNGVGIPKANLSKIFDPFFTTKEIGKGTGLGLSIVYGIIKRHYGSIEILSEENQGTEFVITLPKEIHRI